MNHENNSANLFALSQIDLIELARALWKNILVIALTAVLFGSIFLAYTVFMLSPTYQATASIYVNSGSVSFGNATYAISAGQLSTSNSLVPTYIYILKSRTTLEEVIKEADLSYSPTTLGAMISTKTVPETSAFEVTVTSGDPAQSELIANAIAKILPNRVSEIVDGSSVRVVDYAIIPARRSGPNPIRNIERGILLGAVLSAGLVLLTTYLKNQSSVMIQSADELRAMFPDLVTLAQVPDMRNKERNGYYASYYYKDKTSQKEAVKRGSK